MGLERLWQRYDARNVTNLTDVIASRVTLKDPQGVALDLLARKLYWCDSGADGVDDGAVYRADLDGRNAELIYSAGLWDPMGLVLDLRNYTMIVVDESAGANGNGAVIKANMAHEADVVGSDVAYYANRTWWQKIAETYAPDAAGPKGSGDGEEMLYCQVALEKNETLFIDDPAKFPGLEKNEDFVKFGYGYYIGAPWRQRGGLSYRLLIAALLVSQVGIPAILFVTVFEQCPRAGGRTLHEQKRGIPRCELRKSSQMFAELRDQPFDFFSPQG